MFVTKFKTKNRLQYHRLNLWALLKWAHNLEVKWWLSDLERIFVVWVEVWAKWENRHLPSVEIVRRDFLVRRWLHCIWKLKQHFSKYWNNQLLFLQLNWNRKILFLTYRILKFSIIFCIVRFYSTSVLYYLNFKK